MFSFNFDVSSNTFSLLPQIITFAPFSASFNAIPLPIPEPPPVTNAIFPSNFFMIFYLHIMNKKHYVYPF